VFDAFTDAILHGGKPIIEASEGLKGLTLGNAIMLSSFLGHPVELPFDEATYAGKLQELIRASGGARP